MSILTGNDVRPFPVISLIDNPVIIYSWVKFAVKLESDPLLHHDDSSLPVGAHAQFTSDEIPVTSIEVTSGKSVKNECHMFQYVHFKIKLI